MSEEPARTQQPQGEDPDVAEAADLVRALGVEERAEGAAAGGQSGAMPPAPPTGEAVGAGAAAAGPVKLTNQTLMELYRGGGGGEGEDGEGEEGERDTREKHKFWGTQPVPQTGDEVDEVGPIDEVKTPEDVQQEPYNMPPGYNWCEVDVLDEAQLNEVYNLLTENYVEDDDNLFRFDYSPAFLRWALTPPGASMNLWVGVRTNRGRLVGFISGIPATMRVHSESIPMVEINFLCVHKKLRSKRLAPVLIKEITRRVNLTNVWQAVYTAGALLPRPVTRCRYYHRSINPKKLIEVGFTRLKPRMTMARTIKLHKLPTNPELPTLRSMTEADVPGVHILLNEYLSKFKMAPHLSEEEIRHWLLPREGVIDTFVVVSTADAEAAAEAAAAALTGDGDAGAAAASGDGDGDGSGEGTGAERITDMCSFYHLPSSVIGNDKHSTLYAAYSYYNVAKTMPWKVLMRNCLIMARARNMDVFNALNIQDNAEFLEDLNFGIGDGHLQYYLYNYRCPQMEPNELGLVLL